MKWQYIINMNLCAKIFSL